MLYLELIAEPTQPFVFYSREGMSERVQLIDYFFKSNYREEIMCFLEDAFKTHTEIRLTIRSSVSEFGNRIYSLICEDAEHSHFNNFYCCFQNMEV